MDKWYLMNPYGQTVSDVILAGPFDTEDEVHEAGSAAGIADSHAALLDVRKVERHLAEDRRLVQWLKERK